ncbi:hypothetical protein [Streptacidiphilus jiangxiensis]|uniref:ABC-2 family transporter protein n=1 Tax=Streptacidiphilus jiangxiensis TaxID=235985 RepID=A0A1H7JB43_STRJI|nr:hypothetical protein [Streptacidiphilus jiangxiensis]SEK71117.1 hypothetical protein SAMN05414137_103193 [Streptacidiphilus jiangxiensis]
MNARLRPYLLVVLLPLVAALLLWAFVWPAARIAPHELPLGLVGPDPAVVRVEQQLAAQAGPHGFDVHRYADAAAARTAIEHRAVYGALVLPGSGAAPAGPELMTASAASPVVATLLTQLAGQVPGTTVTDVVPLPSGDPHGSAFVSGVLPTVILGLAMGVLTFLLGRGRGQRLLMLVLASITVAAAVVTLTQGWLGVLGGAALANVGVVALTLLAVSSAVCGFATLLGYKGIGLAALLLMLLGNAWSGAGSAPELLPGAAFWIGRLLPAGAGASALRDTAFFDGHAIGFPLTVLGVWTVLGLGLVAFAGRRAGQGQGHGQAHGHGEAVAPIATSETAGHAAAAVGEVDATSPANAELSGTAVTRRATLPAT